MKIRIAYASGNYDDPLTGGDLHNSRLLKAMTDYDMEPYHAWIGKLPLGLNHFKNYINFITNILFRADVLVLDCGVRDCLTLAKISRLVKPNLPLVGIMHYLNSERPPEIENIPFWNKWESRFFKLLDTVICVNPFAYRQLLGKGMSKKKIFLNIGGYHPDFIMKRKISPTQERLNILFCGYVGEIKGVHVLIDAIDRLDSKLKIHFHIAGSLSKYPEYAKKIISNTILKNLTEKVSFWDDIRGPALIKMYDICDIMVLPSLYEGYPLSIIEAQSRGLAVISTYAGGIPDAVEDNISGRLVQPGDPEALALAIEEISNDFRLREHLTRGGYDKVMSLPPWKKTCEDFSEIIHKVYSQ